jgi:putative transposon-encoded protein
MVTKVLSAIEGIVKPHGSGAYITLPKEWIGKTVIVKLKIKT